MGSSERNRVVHLHDQDVGDRFALQQFSCRCGETRPDQFWPSRPTQCKPCCRVAQAKQRQTRNDYETKNRELQYQAKYGITIEEYNRLLIMQELKCATCGLDAHDNVTPSGKVIRLAVDHDHDTEKVRGLLCRSCNLALGYIKDNVETAVAMAEYLRLHKVVKS